MNFNISGKGILIYTLWAWTSRYINKYVYPINKLAFVVKYNVKNGVLR